MLDLKEINDKYLENLCHNLRLIRAYRGFSRKKMAKCLHISEKTLESFEQNIIPSKVTPRFLWYAQEAFGIAPFLMFAYKLDEVFKKLTRNDKYYLLKTAVMLSGEELPDHPEDETSE